MVRRQHRLPCLQRRQVRLQRLVPVGAGEVNVAQVVHHPAGVVLRRRRVPLEDAQRLQEQGLGVVEPSPLHQDPRQRRDRPGRVRVIGAVLLVSSVNVERAAGEGLGAVEAPRPAPQVRKLHAHLRRRRRIAAQDGIGVDELERAHEQPVRHRRRAVVGIEAAEVEQALDQQAAGIPPLGELLAALGPGQGVEQGPLRLLPLPRVPRLDAGMADLLPRPGAGGRARGGTGVGRWRGGLVHRDRLPRGG